ncbi:hypothetical protein AAF712_013162 [Marasmius tenuissimus]|uniref:Cytochrome P450 n=1 Tax=Marasmius tenuissimus TaxID=585030 RepID=A0ABR2ZHW5_9AGAR
MAFDLGPVTYFIYLPLAGVATVLTLLVLRAKRRSLSFLQGPPNPSYFLGNENEIQNQMTVGQLTFKWFETHGTAFRAKTCWDEDMLITCDPRALQYIFQGSQYRFRKAIDTTQATMNLFGEGIVAVEGSQHQRQRKIMTPAFSATQTKQLGPFFVRAARDLAKRWRDHLKSGESDVIDTTKWFPNMTLDVLGESVFDYEFGALDKKNSELAVMVRDLFVDTKRPTPLLTLYRNLRRSVPDFAASFLMSFPLFQTKEDVRWAKWLSTSNTVAKKLFENKMKSKTYEENDILGVLARSTNAKDKALSMSSNEAMNQLATIIMAGHETSASSLSWLFYELSQRPEHQKRILQEIKSVRERNSNEGDLSSSELDSMPFFNACIKESLRLHPIVFQAFRQSEGEDVIPLAYPVTGTSGTLINEIPIAKGQRIMIDIAAYNRLKQVWGDDAEEWNPERFLDVHKPTTVGVYGNLMTFSAGHRACIGWRFAVLEIQSVAAELIESFEFKLPKDTYVVGLPAGFKLPFVVGEWHKGPQMPLHTKIREGN